MSRANAVFVDVDGTVVKTFGARPTNSLDEVELLSGVIEGFQRIDKLGLRTIAVSNQGGVGLGFITNEFVLAKHKRINELLLHAGSKKIDSFYYCADSPFIRCECRKPRPGMLLQAAKDLEIDLSTSYMVGDGLPDMAAGVNAGISHRILVLGGWEQASPAATHTARDMVHVAGVIAKIEAGLTPVREVTG